MSTLVAEAPEAKKGVRGVGYFFRKARQWLPTGGALPAASWQMRHRMVLGLLVAHAVGLAAFALYQGFTPLHAAFEGGVVAVFALVAAWPRLQRRAQAAVAAAGLMSSSAILTHLSGGYIEAHFHFFVMVGIISLYEDWFPFLLSISYVALHHGIIGTLDPSSVFNHPAAIADPWRWAAVHAVFILGMSVASVFAWRVAEQARSQAMEASARHTAILTSALDAIVTIDRAGKIVEFNPAAEEIFGYTREEAMGREMADLIVPPSLPESHHAGLARFGEGRAPDLGRRVEMPAMRKDGSVFQAELTIVSTPSAEGPLFTGHLRDITHQRAALQELEAARLQLAQSEKLTAIGQLVSGVAHEVRTPLTYLNTNLHLLERRLDEVKATLPEESRDVMDDVHVRMSEAFEASERIKRLVDDLRRYSKLRIGVQKEASLHVVVREAVDLFVATHRSEIRVESNLRPAPSIRMDRVKVQQIVLNLLQNAAEATAANGIIRVETKVHGAGALLIVEDNGSGIPIEARDRIFDPFFTTKEDGTGLGLSIVRRLADEHGARIDLSSPPEGGTRFEILFPCIAERGPAHPDPSVGGPVIAPRG